MANALRVLSEDEASYVAGSSIVVTHSGMSWDDFWSYYSVTGGTGGGGGGGGGDYGGGGGSGNDTSAEEANPSDADFTEAVEASAQSTIDILQHDINEAIKSRGGVDFQIKVGEELWSAKELALSLGKLSTLMDAYEAHELTNNLLNGNADYADALGFIAAAAGSAALLAAGAPVSALVAGVTLGYLVPIGARALGDAFVAAYQEMSGYIMNESGVFENVNGNQLPAQQEYNWILDLFGIPNNQYEYQSSYTPNYNSPYGYIDPALAAYYMAQNPNGYQYYYY